MDCGSSEKRDVMKSSSAAAGDDAAKEGVEEISPDMLKNTPSNIRRLASEIEEIEARHKYLAQTTSPSDGSDVRWYFSKVPLRLNELAASVPQTEIVGKGDYFRFGLRDSLAIEASFLQREEDLLCSWWKEYAECSEGPRGFKPVYNLQLEETSAASVETAHHLYAAEEERVGIPVKGGLYEVDLVNRHCFPVYWSGENRRVIRGHWFARKGSLDWLPLREDISEQVEFAYRGKVWRRRTFQASGLFAARVDMQGTTPGLHALFTGEDDTWEAWLNADASGFINAIARGGNGIKLRRGYAPSLSSKPTQDELRQQQEEEMDNYCSQVPVRHLVFMVHGIGQRLEKSNLVDDVADFHRLTADLSGRHLTSYQRGTQRVLFIPCQWRKGLKLSGENAVENLTLDGIRKLRVVLSATVHDVLYYMSPIYCQTVIDSVSNQLNRLYLKFLKRNPGYDGKVSIFGHSLGSVLSYDILCHQDTLISLFRNDWMFQEGDHDEQLSNSGGRSDYNVTANVEGTSCINVGSADKEDTRSLSDLQGIDDKQEEGSYSSRDPPSNYSVVATATNYNHGNASDISASYENVSDYNDKSERLSDDRAPSNGCSSNEVEAAKCLEDRTDEGISESDHEKSIRLLTEEVALLKSKLNEMESRSEGKLKNIQTNENNLASDSLSAGTNSTSKSYTPYIKYTKLEFKVDTFFAVGSPLGVFLALRNVRIGIGKGQHYWEEKGIIEEMPACQQMFNIFHPFDPVAYRIEPLVCKEHVKLRPVLIPYHRGGRRLYIKFQHFSEGLASKSQAFKHRMRSLRVKVLTICESQNKDCQDEGPEHPEGNEDRPYGSMIMEKLTGSEDGRIDHALQDKTFRHPYLSALGSHTNYWRDPDTALFILKHLYRHVPEEPPFIHDGISEDDNNWKFWYEQLDEELPLTFADKVFVKDFLVKAKMYRNL